MVCAIITSDNFLPKAIITMSSSICQSYIYIITDGHNFKVGITTRNPKKRLKQLQTGNSNKLEFIEVFEVEKTKLFKIEKECHKRLQNKFPKHGEWFSEATAFAVRIIVDEVCEEYK